MTWQLNLLHTCQIPLRYLGQVQSDCGNLSYISIEDLTITDCSGESGRTFALRISEVSVLTYNLKPRKPITGTQTAMEVT